jgi:enterochelin esterase-like enzyme
MAKQPGRSQQPALFQIALVFILLSLSAAAVLMIVLLRVTMPAPLANPTAVSIRVTPTATRTLPPTAVPKKSPGPTPRPTRTRRPWPSPIPTQPPATGQSPLATPDPEQFRCQETTGQVTDETYSSRTSNSEQGYIVYLPPCYEFSTAKYPTLYLLHGTENDDTQWERLGVFEAMDEGLRSGRFAPAIIVLPDGDPDLFVNTSGGLNSFEGQLVEELVPIVDRLFRTDPRPEMRAIGGVSRGGVWSLEIGFLHPALFSIVAGHSPCLNVNEAPPEYDPLKLTDAPSLKTQRIWLDAGDMDYCQPGADDLHMALDSSGVAHEYHIWPGLHDDTLWVAHLTDYLEFYTQAWPKPTVLLTKGSE